MKHLHKLKALPVIIGVLAAVVAGVFLNLYIIGEPIDGAQVHYTISEHGNKLELRAEAVESAVALRGWKFNQEGNTLYISARKVLVSPLFNDGSYKTTIDLGEAKKISLGGQVIWTKPD